MCAPVAQLDRASASGVEGHEFESRRVYHFFALFIEKKIRARNFLSVRIQYSANNIPLTGDT